MDKHVKDAAQGAAEDVLVLGAAEDAAEVVPQDYRDLAFGARPARALLATPPPLPLPVLYSSRLAEMRAQLGSSVAYGSGCGQALPGVPRKALLC